MQGVFALGKGRREKTKQGMKKEGRRKGFAKNMADLTACSLAIWLIKRDLRDSFIPFQCLYFIDQK
ncbi:hypothetical protein A1D29_02885 [Pasteurellaceae bacterium Orientalotternb1]|nr:hypothetical protein A1D29_02885 [Pasteurellaceae bacterium Orientalotternb1]